MPKTIKPLDQRKRILKATSEALRRTEGRRLHPVRDMGVRDSVVKRLCEQIEDLEVRIREHPLHTSDERSVLLELYSKKLAIHDELMATKRHLKTSESIQQLDELKSRKRVLRRLKFCTEDDVIELKGRVACEINTGDELLITEMIFNGVFNDLTGSFCCVGGCGCLPFSRPCFASCACLPELTLCFDSL